MKVSHIASTEHKTQRTQKRRRRGRRGGGGHRSLRRRRQQEHRRCRGDAGSQIELLGVILAGEGGNVPRASRTAVPIGECSENCSTRYQQTLALNGEGGNDCVARYGAARKSVSLSRWQTHQVGTGRPARKRTDVLVLSHTILFLVLSTWGRDVYGWSSSGAVEGGGIWAWRPILSKPAKTWRNACLIRTPQSM